MATKRGALPPPLHPPSARAVCGPAGTRAGGRWGLLRLPPRGKPPGSGADALVAARACWGAVKAPHPSTSRRDAAPRGAAGVGAGRFGRCAGVRGIGGVAPLGLRSPAPVGRNNPPRQSPPGSGGPATRGQRFNRTLTAAPRCAITGPPFVSCLPRPPCFPRSNSPAPLRLCVLARPAPFAQTARALQPRSPCSSLARPGLALAR